MLVTQCPNKAVFLAAFLALITLAASQTPAPNCLAEITLNSSYPALAFYIYHDIIVENTGLCDITEVFVEITLPPYDSAFAYYNISNQTGQLLGLAQPMHQGSVQVGGTIVLNSARTPLVSLISAHCSTSCNAPPPAIAPGGNESVVNPSTTPSPTQSPSPTPTPTSAPFSPTLKLAMHLGVNSYWFALNIVYNDEAIIMSNVLLRDSATYSSWQNMTEASWEGVPTYTFSPMNGPLTLPLTLKLETATTPHEVVVLRNIITTYSATVIDTEVEYAQSD